MGLRKTVQIHKTNGLVRQCSVGAVYQLCSEADEKYRIRSDNLSLAGDCL